ncbi:MAG TPA: HPr family phosphocarrier protein [Candidatus Limiplasma sp.]|jgi:phosphotransferase system HPr (HPr) family protein|nr:HPr family phosphocarrier protein [Candidatus Limiplasma sp.]HPR78436.1 HPr family phosphocarrier protein [Candidatus Limiplasma sp.]
MIRTELDLRPLMPFTRLTAARLATAAGRYESRLTLECEGLVLNMKSMLGLLSQAKLPDGRAMLVADGPDEQAATQAVLDALTRQQA